MSWFSNCVCVAVLLCRHASEGLGWKDFSWNKYKNSSENKCTFWLLYAMLWNHTDTAVITLLKKYGLSLIDSWLSLTRYLLSRVEEGGRRKSLPVQGHFLWVIMPQCYQSVLHGKVVIDTLVLAALASDTAFLRTLALCYFRSLQ